MKVQRLIEHLKAKGQWSPELKIKILDKSCGVLTESTVDTNIRTCTSCLTCNCNKVKSLNESLDKPVHAWNIKNGVVTVRTFEE